MAALKSYYDIMGIKEDATPREIKLRYRELARKYHPDLYKHKGGENTDFKLVNQANQVLSDPSRRAEYDQQLRSDRTNAARANGTSAPAGAGSSSSPSGPARSPAEITSLVAQAEMAMTMGQASEAEKACQDVLKSSPRHVKALEIFGDANMQLQKFSDAVEAYRKAQAIAPNSMLQSKLERAQQRMSPRPSPSSAKPAAGSKPSGGAKQAAPSGGNIFSRFLGRK